MRSCGAVIVALAMLVVVGTPSRALAQRRGGSNAGARAAIEAIDKKFLEGVAKHDATLIASTYTPDAEAFPANSDVVKGRAAIQKFWQSVLDSGIASAELNTTEVSSSGDLAYEVGTYTMKTKDGKLADRGKYCVVWKRTNGQWLLHRDIWTTSVPQAATK